MTIRFPPFVPQPAREAIKQWFDACDGDQRDLLTRLAFMHAQRAKHSILDTDRPCNTVAITDCQYCKGMFKGSFDGSICILKSNDEDIQLSLNLLRLLMAFSGLSREALNANGEVKSVLDLYPELDDAAHWDVKQAYILLMDSIETDEGWLRFIMSAIWACGDYSDIRSKVSESQRSQAHCSNALEDVAESLKYFARTIEELKWLRVVREEDFGLEREIGELIKSAGALSAQLDQLEDRHIGLHVVAALSRQSRNEKTAYLRALAGLLTTVDGFLGCAVTLNLNILKAMAIIATIVFDEDITYDYVRKALEDFVGPQ